MRLRPLRAKSDLARIAGFAMLFAGSLVLTAATNRVAGRALDAVARGCAWMATAAIPSFLLIGSVYVLFGDRRALRWPRPDRSAARGMVNLAFAWLAAWMAGYLLAAVLAGRWITYAHGLPSVAAFLVFGPLGEEMLFRGLVFEQASRLWPGAPIVAIAMSTAAFALHHVFLQTAPPMLAEAQLLFVLPMGVTFAILRARSGSLWPGFMLHVATNLPGIF